MMNDTSLTVLQHVEEEPAGLFLEYAASAGIPCTVIPLYETRDVPTISSTHLLILGGPMSVNDGAYYPFIEQEMRLIRSWIGLGRPLLGICLGAQMIAGALGGKIVRCTTETGWSPVEVRDTGVLKGFPSTFMVFQIHGETFSIPHGGNLVCEGRIVQNQALAAGSALGLQFHLEPTVGMIHKWVRGLPGEIQSKILEETGYHIKESERLCHLLCRRFFDATPEGFSWSAR